MHARDEPREPPEAQRLRGNQFDPMTRKPKDGDRLARRQAGAFTEQDFGPLHRHVDFICRHLLSGSKAARMT